jgi:hypothetical protein
MMKERKEVRNSNDEENKNEIWEMREGDKGMKQLKERKRDKINQQKD